MHNTVKDLNEYSYVITMITFNCGEIYSTGVIGIYDTVKDAEDAISHLCRNKQKCIEGQNKGYTLGTYEYYPKPSEGYKFIVEQLKKNTIIGSTFEFINKGG